MKWISFSRCCSVSLAVLACLFVSSCRKAGPYGFKVGQEYEWLTSSGEVGSIVEVTDVGSDWVEFERKKDGRKFRRAKDRLEKGLSYFRLID